MTTSTTPPPHYTPPCMCGAGDVPARDHTPACPRTGIAPPRAQRITAAAHALAAAERTTDPDRAATLRAAADRWLQTP